jgi:hypothetical protein
MIYYSEGFPVLRYKLFDLKQPEISKEHQQDLLPLVYSQVKLYTQTLGSVLPCISVYFVKNDNSANAEGTEHVYAILFYYKLLPLLPQSL